MRLNEWQYISSYEYHRGPENMWSLSGSGLVLLSRSPADWLERVMNPEEPTKAKNFGSAFHAILGEPQRNLVAVVPDFDRRTKNGKERYAEWHAENFGKILITMDEMETIARMCDAVHRHPVAGAILSDYPNKQIEMSGAIKWEPDNVSSIKIRPDILIPRKLIADIKTTNDASPEAFEHTISKYKYHWSAALQCKVAGRIDDCIYSDFLWIACQKTPPYPVMCYDVGLLGLECGWDYVIDLIRLFEKCTVENNWPPMGFEDKFAVRRLNIKQWAE